MKAKLLQLLTSGLITQSVLTLGFAAVIWTLTLTGRTIQPELWQALWAILGFWFGSTVTKKVQPG